MKHDGHVKEVRHVRIGKAQTKPTAPTHTPGVHQGGAKGSYEKMEGHLKDGTSNSRRSTGVSPKSKNPIRPDMPKLSPA